MNRHDRKKYLRGWPRQNFNRRKLEAAASANQYEFHPLLDLQEITARRILAHAGFNIGFFRDRSVVERLRIGFST